MNNSNWQWFKIGTLFSLQKCKCSNATDLLEDGDEIAYIGAKKNDNGVMKYVNKVDRLITPGNCIVFIGDGQGSVGYCIYQPVDFIGSTTLIAGYNEHINPYVASFLIAILDKERYRYSFGRKYKKEIIENSKIQLPAIRDERNEWQPDWQYMENYIKENIIPQLPKKAQQVWQKQYDILPVNPQPMQLNTKDWKWFVIKDLFDVKAGKYHYKDEYEQGITPYLSATAENNGVGDRINLSPEFKGGVITTEKVQCTPFYQPVDFCATSDVNIIARKDGKPMNQYVGLFISSIIEFNESFRWTYGRQCRVNDTEKIRIKLPVTPTGEPDWQFMEDYIKSLPYSRNIESTDPNELVNALQKKVKELEQQLQQQSHPQTPITNYGTVNIIDNSRNYNIK